ncbi:MAG: ABC-2 family transporter protein [Fibrobacteres bacterium]|nr:ABC-2 family transporter protein [Fibrobacterota bacterium]
MIAWRFYLNNLQRLVSYRAEFWIGFVGTLISQIGVAYFLWRAIFHARGVETLRGYTFGGMMLYYLLVPLVERVGHVQDMAGFSGEIYDGGLSRYLLYPVSYFRIKYAANLAQATVYLCQLVLILLGYGIAFGLPAGFSAVSILQGIIALGASATLCFFLSATVEMVAFWADNVWSLWILVRMTISLLGGGMIPLTFFPVWARAALAWLPFGSLIDFPIRCLLGKTGWGEWMAGLLSAFAWTGIFGAATAVLWRRGLKSYAGVGI